MRPCAGPPPCAGSPTAAPGPGGGDNLFIVVCPTLVTAAVVTILPGDNEKQQCSLKTPQQKPCSKDTNTNANITHSIQSHTMLGEIRIDPVKLP